MVAQNLIELPLQQGKLERHTVISVCITKNDDEILFTNMNIPSNLSQVGTDQWQFPQNSSTVSFWYKNNEGITGRTSDIYIVDDLEQNKDLIVRKKDAAIQKSDAIFCRSTCKLYQMSRNKDWTNSISSPKKNVAHRPKRSYLAELLS